MPSAEITRLLACLEPFPDSAPVVLKDIGDSKHIERADLLGAMGFNAAQAATELIRHLTDAVQDFAGPEAADEDQEFLLQRVRQAKKLLAGHCREVLLRRALSKTDMNSLEEFASQMPGETLASLGFEAMSPFMRLAVMNGVRQGVEMMQELVLLPEMDEGVLHPDSLLLPLESVHKVQKILGKSVNSWGASILDCISRSLRKRDLPQVMEAVGRLLHSTKPKLMTQFVEALTMGAVADIFVVQSLLVKETQQFDEAYPFPPGMDGKGPAERYSLFGEFLFDAACRYIRQQRGLSVQRLITAEARMLLPSDARIALASLYRMYLNSLLSELPDEEALRPRANVKGFDVDGFHADFIRDCIARRYSFTIDGHGRLQNALDREQAVAGGKRDLRFYEQLREGFELQAEAMIPEGEAEPDLFEEEGPEWEKPEVRATASLTQEDLKQVCEAAALGIPEISQRMAVTCLAHQANLNLLEAFFGKDQAAGILLLGSFKHMNITFGPATGRLCVSAMLLHDGLRTTGLRRAEPMEIPLGRISFTQLEYTAVLKKRKVRGDDEPRWRVSRVNVETLAPYFVPAHV